MTVDRHAFDRISRLAGKARGRPRARRGNQRPATRQACRGDRPFHMARRASGKALDLDHARPGPRRQPVANAGPSLPLLRPRSRPRRLSRVRPSTLRPALASPVAAPSPTPRPCAGRPRPFLRPPSPMRPVATKACPRAALRPSVSPTTIEQPALARQRSRQRPMRHAGGQQSSPGLRPSQCGLRVTLGRGAILST